MWRTIGYLFVAVTATFIGWWAVSVGFGLAYAGPFILIGLAMLLAFPWRRRREVLWPVLMGVGGFWLGTLLVAPLQCSTYTTFRSGAVVSGSTRCMSAIFEYSGGVEYEPPLFPAVLAGLATATVGALVMRVALTGNRPRISPRSASSTRS